MASRIKNVWQSIVKKIWSRDPEVVYGVGSPGALPSKSLKLEPLHPHLICSYTGPKGGIAAMDDQQRNGGRAAKDDQQRNGIRPSPGSGSNYAKLSSPIAGSSNWCQKHDCAYGTALSLYDQPIDHDLPQGEPVADVFAISVRPNSCVMALADGVGWGEKPRLAARCAVRGCMEFIHQELFVSPECFQYTALNTDNIAHILLKSLRRAQDLIIQKEGTMTTLCVSLVCPLLVPDGDKTWAMVTVNVGDSLAYVYSPTTGRVREVTVGSHIKDRDMRDAGGVLGPADGVNPDLENLTCSLTTLRPGDMVFLTSDGVSDNFDPVVLRKARPVPTSRTPVEQTASLTMELPLMTRVERQNWQVSKMAEVLNANLQSEEDRTARLLCASLVDFAVRHTHERRELLEAPDVAHLSELPREERTRVQNRLEEQLRTATGKLDHAAVVAFKVQQLEGSRASGTSRKHARAKDLARDLGNL